MSRMRLILLLCGLAAASAQNRNKVRVKISERGLIGNYIEDGDYVAFYGVEYGCITSGKLRFKAPGESNKFNYRNYDDVVAANKGVKCAQPTSNGIIGIEDCLVLDIYTKNIKTPDQPVLVWLEGEDYERNSNISYPIENLVQEGLVVVSVKYRLSVFGFLCLGIPEAPGNAGLQDVILALKWIQKHITEFGGNPKNVILAGHGSGAAMVDLITLSPLSENLVHKALVLSGSGLAPWALTYDPIADAERIANALKHMNKTRSELAELFETADLHVLGGALASVLSKFEKYNNPPLFAPCIENPKLKSSSKALLEDAPINILRSGKYNDIPYLVGFTDLEGTMRDVPSIDDWGYDILKYLKKYLPIDIDNKNVNVTAIRNLYFGVNPIANITNILRFQGDVLVLGPMTRGALVRAATSKSAIRVFEFAYPNGTIDKYSKFDKSATGARHGELLNYLFNYNLERGSDDPSRGIRSRVVAFAKTGSAQPPETLEWDPVTDSKFRMIYLHGFQPGPHLYSYREERYFNINEKRTNFWSKIYATNYRVPKSAEITSSANSLLGFSFAILLTQIIIRFV